jgi:uncharacterized membrane protein
VVLVDSLNNVNFLFFVMFWTILAMMLVMIYSLKLVMRTQRHIESIDVNIAKMVGKVLKEEDQILANIKKKK